MNLTAELRTALIRLPSLTSDTELSSLLGSVYETNEENEIEGLVTVLAYGSHSVSPPFSWQLRSLGCHILLYTKNGRGALNCREGKFSLKERTLLFFDCRQPFSVSIDGDFWNFELYFLTGSAISAFSPLIDSKTMPFDLSGHSEISGHLQMLEKNNRNPLRRNEVLDVKCFTNILSDLALDCRGRQEEADGPAPHLLYMKKFFDTSFAAHYSLTDFEQTLNVSKYRLCRDFSAAFGVSPLQYLNERRLSAARELLLTTDIPVHEIASSVGFDTTNHFISLFKRANGLTPGAYRRQQTHKK